LGATTPFSLPQPIEEVLITRTAVLWIGLTLMATAATLVLLLLLPREAGVASEPRA
jgi:hypothetical protein